MLIIKIGGGKEINAEGIIKDLSDIKEKFIIIHGANYYRDELALKLEKEKKVITSISGYSSVYSDESAIDLLMMAYAGLRNKKIVELCQMNGINAIGLSGLDGKVIRGERNKGIRVIEDGRKKILRDLSGKPKEVNVSLLNLLMENGYTPVLCVPIIDENNTAINSENDDIVNLLQDALQADKIIQLIESPGYLEDKDNPESLIKEISRNELNSLEEKSGGRMKRKMLAIKKLFDRGAVKVFISDGRTEHPVKEALLGKGTVVS